MSDGLRAEFDPVLTSMGGMLFFLILATVLGVMPVTSEYASGMVRTTFIVTPQRTRVFAARATAIGLLGMAISVILVPAMFLVSQPIFSYYGLETASATDHDAARYLIIATLLQGLFHTLIPFSFAWILRGTASAITVSLGFVVLPWMIAPLVPLWIQENVLRYFPDTAKDSLLGVSEAGDPTYLGDTAAIIVIAVWLVGLLVAAAVVLHRRDV
jgi:ABC-type transport system involved in multi-copper enzyme maturation permease subunit